MIMIISGSEVSLIGLVQCFTSRWEITDSKNEKKEKMLFTLIYPLGKHFLKGDEKSLKYFQLSILKVNILVRPHVIIFIYLNYEGLLTFILW